MIKEPYYEKSIGKWVVDCGTHLHYFADGETADDFFIINKARKNEKKITGRESKDNE